MLALLCWHAPRKRKTFQLRPTIRGIQAQAAAISNHSCCHTFTPHSAKDCILNTSTNAPAPANDSLAQDFVAFAVQCGVLRFGSFVTKAGRQSPYFFNAGLFNDGAMLGQLARFYAQRIIASDIACDMLFGRNLPFAYNRKEAKDHGEGGTLVGAPLQGRVLIVDDVMSAGTAVRESIALIKAANATPAAVAVALDRQEKATEGGQDVPYSAVQYVRQQLGMQVCAIATLDDLLAYLGSSTQAAQPEMAQYHTQVIAYRQRYGVTNS